jgi:hypothetical protein
MRPEHEAATDRDGGCAADGTASIVGAGSDISEQVRDRDLLGVMLQCQTPADVKQIMFTVPAEAFADPLNAAIWRAAEALADHGVCGPVAVVKTVVAAGLWPRDCHHEVTGRVIDAITDVRFDADDWSTPAVEVLYAYGRRTAAARLAHVARILPSGRLHKVAADLFAVAEFVETVAHWVDWHDPEVQAA